MSNASRLAGLREALGISILLDTLTVAEVVNGKGRAPVCLVCEHASGHIPAELGDLGLAAEDRYSHAALDIGAEALARSMSDSLDAPLVLATVSRLVCDLNRPAGSEDATPAQVERIVVPGNQALGKVCRIGRARSVYHPFHSEVARVLSGFATPPALVTLHSFTPTWHGAVRDSEIGLLHDTDDRLAKAMMAAGCGSYRSELNQPYSAADGVTHTLQRHASEAPNVMIEVRNDLLSDPDGIKSVSGALTNALRAALADGCAA